MDHSNENHSTLEDSTTQLWLGCWSIYGCRTWGCEGRGTRNHPFCPKSLNFSPGWP